MNPSEPDPIDEALRALREDDALRRPDAALQQRLMHHPLRGRRPRMRRAALWLTLSLGLGGAGLAARSVLGSFSGLWASVEVEGQRQQARSDDEGRSSFVLHTPSGSRLEVLLHRHGDARSPTTDLEIREESADELLEDSVQLGPAPEPTRRDRGSLDEALRLCSWGSPPHQQALYLRGEGRETAVLLDEDAASPEVLELVRVPRPLPELSTAELFERSEGGRELRLSDGLGWQFAWRWAGETLEPSNTYRTEDGRVQVEWEDGR